MRGRMLRFDKNAPLTSAEACMTVMPKNVANFNVDNVRVSNTQKPVTKGSSSSGAAGKGSASGQGALGVQLYNAASEGKMTEVERLLNAKADPNDKDKDAASVCISDLSLFIVPRAY